MDPIFKEVSNPAWWFTVVFTGALISVLSSYIKSYADKILSSISAKTKYAIKKEEDERSATINRLIEFDELRLSYRFNVIETMVIALLIFIFSFMMMILQFFVQWNFFTQDYPPDLPLGQIENGVFTFTMIIILTIINMSIWLAGIRMLVKAFQLKLILREAEIGKRTQMTYPSKDA